MGSKHIAIIKMGHGVGRDDTARLELIDKYGNNHLYFIFTSYFTYKEALEKMVDILTPYNLECFIFDYSISNSIAQDYLAQHLPDVPQHRYANGIRVKQITDLNKVGDDVHVNESTEVTAPFTRTFSFHSQLNINIGYKLMNPDAPIPVYNKVGDSGFDFVAMETVIIPPGGTALIPIGLAFELPTGLEIQIRPRSGISSKTKARVTLGTDDANYRGELKVNVDNITLPTYMVDKETMEIGFRMGNEAKSLTNEIVPTNEFVPLGSIIIRKGERIAQGVIAYVFKGNFFQKEELSETERGETGFGHTGV